AVALLPPLAPGSAARGLSDVASRIGAPPSISLGLSADWACAQERKIERTKRAAIFMPQALQSSCPNIWLHNRTSARLRKRSLERCRDHETNPAPRLCPPDIP